MERYFVQVQCRFGLPGTQVISPLFMLQMTAIPTEQQETNYVRWLPHRNPLCGFPIMRKRFMIVVPGLAGLLSAACCRDRCPRWECPGVPESFRGTCASSRGSASNRRARRWRYRPGHTRAREALSRRGVFRTPGRGGSIYSVRLRCSNPNDNV